MVETVLSKFIDTYSNKLVNDIFAVFYASPSIRFLIYALAVINICLVAQRISEGESPKGLIVLCLTLLFIAPVRQGAYPNLPAGYFVVSTVGNLMSANLERVLMKQLREGGGKSIPPGFFLNALVKSQAASINDPEIARSLEFVVDNCVPETNNKDGKPATILDLFSGKVASSGGAEAFEVNIDPDLLKRRVVTGPRGESSNCFNRTVGLRQKLRSNLRQQKLTKMEGVEVKKGRDGKQIEVWDPIASSMGRQINRIALNVAEASAIQKQFLKSVHKIDSDKLVPNFQQSTTTAETMMALQATSSNTQGWLTRNLVQIANLPTTISRMLNLEGVLSTSMDIARMNEKGRHLQYTIAYTQLVIKLASIFCFVLILTPLGKKALMAWVFAWIAAENAPVIITIYRTVSNNISMAAMGLTGEGAISPNHPSFLALGVNFNAVQMIQKDIALAMRESVAIEMNIFRAMMVSLPVIGVGIAQFSGGHDMVSKGGKTVARTVTNQAVSAGATMVGGAAAGMATKAALSIGSIRGSGGIGKHGNT